MHSSRTTRRRLYRAFAIATIATAHASAQCFDWAPGFTPAGITGSIADQVVFDDGSGSGDELYFGGAPLVAGDVAAQGIVKWNGARWAGVATTLTSATSNSPSIGSLAVFDGGSGPELYAGGYFASIDGVTASNIAKWNGTSWSPVSGGITVTVFDLAVFDDGNGPALYAATATANAGGVPVHGVAKWNGTSWSSIAASFTHSLGPFMRRLAVADDGSGPALFASGRFSAIDGVSASYIAKWNGVSWSALGSGLSDEAYALIGWDDGNGPALFAGGSFSYAGGNQIPRIAKWRNGVWSPLSGGSLLQVQYVYGFATYDDGSGEQLYVGGQLTVIGSPPSYGLARWSGASWSKPTNGNGLTVGGNATYVSSLAAYDDGNGPGLYVNGPFDRADGLIAQHVARLDAGGWHALGVGNSTSGPLYALHAFDDGNGEVLYAGGSFSAAGAVVADSIARFDGSTWSIVGNGFNCNGTVTALADFDDGGGAELYAGGTFTEIDGTVAHRMAKFDGTSWSALGIGLGNASDTTVNDMLVYDDGSGPALIVSGKFQFAGGNSARRIARWDGTAWSTLGNGFDAQVYSLAAFDDGSGMKLFAGGSYQHADGIVAFGIASWDGVSWSPVGTGMNGEVTALAVFDDGSGPALYATGGFTTAGGVPAQRFAKWNGVSWSQAGGGIFGSVQAMELFDDGSGEALYITGNLITLGGSIPADGIARWNGAQWSTLGAGIDDYDGQALAGFDDGNGAALFVGGSFTFAGGTPSVYIAKWGHACTCPPVSYCTSGTSSNGCVPSIGASGTASASGAGSFVVTASNVEGQKLGLLFYGMSGATSSPWGATSSYLCVKPPQQRTGQLSTAGTSGACDGALVLDFNAYVASHPTSLGQPFSVGDTVRMQGWYRDPPNPKTTSLTDALEFYVCP